MDLRKTLEIILNAAEFPKEEREEFIGNFYTYLLVKLITDLEKADPDSASVLHEASEKFGDDPKLLSDFWEKTAQNPLMMERMKKVAGSVLDQLVDDVSAASTLEQKKRILDELPKNEIA